MVYMKLYSGTYRLGALLVNQVQPASEVPPFRNRLKRLN
jgi:hypothetical protein